MIVNNFPLPAFLAGDAVVNICVWSGGWGRSPGGSVVVDGEPASEIPLQDLSGGSRALGPEPVDEMVSIWRSVVPVSCGLEPRKATTTACREQAGARRAALCFC
eukprot:3799613-Rhodomonas_salina.3